MKEQAQQEPEPPQVAVGDLTAEALLPRLNGLEGPSSNLVTMEELFTRFICTGSRRWAEQLFAIVAFENSFMVTVEEIVVETVEETGMEMEMTEHLIAVILLGIYL